MCDGTKPEDIETLLRTFFGTRAKRVHYLDVKAQQTACCGAERPLWREAETPPIDERRFVEVRYAGLVPVTRFLILTDVGEKRLQTGPP